MGMSVRVNHRGEFLNRRRFLAPFAWLGGDEFVLCDLEGFYVGCLQGGKWDNRFVFFGFRWLWFINRFGDCVEFELSD